MRSLFILLFGSLFFGASYPEVTPNTIFYRSFYSEMKSLEKPDKVTAFGAVQTASNSNGLGSSTVSVTITSSTANNLIVVGIRTTTAVTISSVTDNASNTYAVSSNLDMGGSLRLYQAYAIQSTGGATSVTVTVSANASINAIVNEYSGFSSGNTNATAYDGVATGTGTSTSLSTSTLTPTASGSLIVCTMRANGGSLAAGSGYTAYGIIGTITGMQYKLSSGASETCPATAASGDWGIIGMAFKDDPVVNAPAPALSAAGNVAKTKYKYKNNE